MSGPFGNRGSSESREQTIANGVPIYLVIVTNTFIISP